MAYYFKEKCPMLFGKYRRQLLSALCANIIAVAHGAAIGWLSPTLLILQSSKTPLKSGLLDINEASWLGSLLCVGGFFGNLIFGFISNRWGRKASLCLITFPQMCCWVIMILCNDIKYLYIGRVFAGLTGGGLFVCIPLYVSDIAQKEIRGRLGSYLMFSVNCGTLIGFILGSYLPYDVVPKVIMGIPLIHFCIIIFLPETPQFLLLQNDEEGARRSLCFYRSCSPNNCDKAEKQAIEEELLEMMNITGCIENKTASYKDLFTSEARNGTLLGIGLVAVNIFSGIFVIVNYTSTIFKESGSSIAPNEASIIVSASQIAGTYFSTLFVENFRRKTLLVSTTTVATIGLLLMGASTYLGKFYDLPQFSWVPVASLSLVVFSASSGFIPLTFVVINEVIPRNVRPIASSICMAVLNIFAFASLKVLPMAIPIVGLHAVMWICAAMCSLGVLFNAICIPETRGKLI